MAKFPLQAIITGVDRLTPTLGKIESGLGRFGKKAGKVGKTLSLGVTAPVVGLAASILSTASGFEAAMKTVKANAPDTSPEDMARLTKEARRLGAADTSNFDAREIGEGFGFLAQQGQLAEEMLVNIQPALNGAAGAETDLGETTLRLSRAWTGFGGANTVGFGDFVDDLTTTTISASTNLFELTDSLKDAGPIAAGLGHELEITIATMGRFAQVGFEGSRGSTAFKGGMAKLIAPVGATAEVLDRLGISTADLKNEFGNLKDVPSILDLLTEAGASSTDVLMAMGTEAGPAFLALFQEGSGPIRKLARELGDNFGAAQLKAETQMEGTAGALKALSSAVLEFQLVLAETGLQEWFTTTVKSLTAWVNRMQQANPRLLKLGVAAALFAAAAGPVVLVLAQVTTAVAATTTMLGAMTAAQAGATVGFWAGLIPAVWAFTTALLANPITWLVVGIAAAVVGIIALAKNWDKVVAALKGAWNWYVSTWQVGFQWLLDKIPLLEGLLPDWMKDFLLGDGLKIDVATDESLDAATAAGGAARGQQSHVQVDFANLPPGATVDTRANDGGDLDVDLGYALAAPG